jgi:hypothetical protein
MILRLISFPFYEFVFSVNRFFYKSVLLLEVASHQVFANLKIWIDS